MMNSAHRFSLKMFMFCLMAAIAVPAVAGDGFIYQDDDKKAEKAAKKKAKADAKAARKKAKADAKAAKTRAKYVAKRERVIAMKDATMKRLVTEHPEAEEELKNSVGYGVFSNTGASLFILHGSSGRGMIINTATGEETYMKVKKVGVGLGIGVKDYRTVYIFKTEEIMNQFLEEGEFAKGEFDAAASSDTKGGSVGGVHDENDEVKVYQMTKNGLIIGVHVTGAKYKLDDKLNNL